MRTILRVLTIIWASPWTMLGLIVGGAAVIAGGRATRMSGAIGFWGGFLPRILSELPFVSGAAAVTLGHVVLAQSAADLSWTHGHEMVHVRQYERWGVLFVPAYLVCGFVLWIRRRDPYVDNPFEREAVEKAGTD